MNAFNAVCSAIFDVILAPLGHEFAWLDLAVWSILSGVVALIVYKYVSNQAGIDRAKNQIKMHLLEIRLFRHDIRQVLLSTVRILGKNALYLGHNLVPMVVLMVPFMAVLVQLVANYAYAPASVGDVDLLEVRFERSAAVDLQSVTLDLPPGVELDAPPVRTPEHEIYWRLRATAPGDHALEITAGDDQITKTWAVGGEHRKVPVLRTKSWESLLYPAEGGIPAESSFYELRMTAVPRELPLLPAGELGVLSTYLVLSLLAGFALKDVFGVTL